MNKKLLLAIFCLFFTNVLAGPAGLPVPRFVTIKFGEVNARTGPESDCPIEIIFIQKGEPVEIVAEYGQWRKIRDVDNEGGWVHSSVISGNRSVIITSKAETFLLKNPGQHENIVAKLLPKTRCKFHKCKDDWCSITCESYKGWVARKLLWGVYPEDN